MDTTVDNGEMSCPLMGETLVENMTLAEKQRAARIQDILPVLQQAAAQADQAGEFYLPHVKTFADAGLLGFVVPERYGGMGGSLRDLTAATFAMATACPSTALTFFFHCSSASRALLALQAIEANLFEQRQVYAADALAFPAERGRLMAAQMEIYGSEQHPLIEPAGS